jgi:hypothetical protein
MSAESFQPVGVASDKAWSFWRDSLAGLNPDLPDRPDVPCGYFRDRNNALAVWIDDSGDVVWDRTPAQYVPRNLNELYDAFAYFSKGAITYEAYTAFLDAGHWPEDVAERPIEPAGIGHNSGDLKPFELMRERVRDVGEQVRDFFASIGGAITAQEHADKAANFKSLFGDLEGEAEKARKAEKEPILKAGREIDAAWNPVVELASGSKKKLASLLTPFLREQEAKARAAEKAASDAAQAAGEASPVVAASAKAGTRGRTVSLRTVKAVKITDLSAVAGYLAGINSVELREVCERLSFKLLNTGVPVPGAEIETRKEAA